MKITLKVKTCCDTQFIIRVAEIEPFEYWNRCIVPGTHRGEFKDNIKPNSVNVQIEETPDPKFNYQIVYKYEYMFIDNRKHDPICDAVVMRFGTFNVEINRD